MLTIFQKIRLRLNPSGRVANIDAATAGPPPSPLAPIDLTNEREVSEALDVATRIGDILLASGQSNADVHKQMKSVAKSYGLHYCHLDITFNTITGFSYVHARDIDPNTEHAIARRTPVSVFRVAQKFTVNFGKLSEVDRLIRSIHAGATPPAVATKILDDIHNAPPPYGFGVALCGWGVLAGAIAVYLGGSGISALVTALTAMVIMGACEVLSHTHLPNFYHNVLGGFIAVCPAAVGYHWATLHGVPYDPTQIIAAGVVVLLAGLTLVQGLIDGITGSPVTASARCFHTALVTGGIIGGIYLGLIVFDALGMPLPSLHVASVETVNTAWAKIVCAALASGGFAVASYAEWFSVFFATLTGAVGFAVYYWILVPLGWSNLAGVSVAAVVIGLSGGLLARRYLIPPIVTEISGITAFLPGLSVYRGMYSLLNEQLINGFTYIALALATAGVVAAGMVFGEWLAHKIRRPPLLPAYRILFSKERP